ncbi:hypothetical protein L873DRAFT_79659 [Choiromyces venosus 120613-1]|uniref:Uncharacterized protein n=1 Tax=Choiromyces venosus 120613-1 TaxID=1336337 RepID=A0A3N4JH85_9PEZI|nr:hypothetical protein L873DRAFT_79659 [Choiromyces venosus 120613-1]
MIQNAIHFMALVVKQHLADCTTPTPIQLNERKPMDQVSLLLQKITCSSSLSKDYEPEGAETPGQSFKRDMTNLTQCYIDVPTTTTTTTTTAAGTIWLEHCIYSVECKLNQFLDTSPRSYAAVVQQNLQSPPHSQSPEFPQSSSRRVTRTMQLEDTRFVIALESPVPEAFNPLPLRETLNAVFSDNCSKFTAIQQSRKGNLICYTLGDPSTTIDCFHVWSIGLPLQAIRINTEDKWVRRILYLQTPCLSTIQLDAELKQYNPKLKLATASRLLSPTVALLFLRNEEMPEHVFVFATYKRLAPYNT